MPVTGIDVPELAMFDTILKETMANWSLPGGQVAIARDGRLVFNRGYGYADIEAKEAVEPTARFRIASVSKPVTAVAILKLVEAGKLTLDRPVFPLLALEPAPNATLDPRLDTITVEQLLVHSGGWDSEATYDPQFLPWPLLAASTLGASNPAEAETIVRYMLGVPLDFDPGTRSVYSNFGFNVLGRVIECVSGQPYAQHVLNEVLIPAGITSMQIGKTRLEERLPNEVTYYSPLDLPRRESIYPGEGYVPVGYGSFYMESLDSHGGWIASAADLVRFALAVDGARGEALLTPESVKAMEMAERPPSDAAGAGNKASGHGLGFNVTTSDAGSEWVHAGAIEGSNCSWLIRLAGGATLAFVFNTLPIDYATFFSNTFTKLRDAIAGVTTWPEHDLFA